MEFFYGCRGALFNAFKSIQIKFNKQSQTRIYTEPYIKN